MENMKKTIFRHILIILALFVCTMPKLTRSSTCLDLGITQTCNVCQKVKAYLDQGKKPRKNMNQTCLQPWNWKVTGATHSSTKLKKSSALSELSQTLATIGTRVTMYRLHLNCTRKKNLIKMIVLV